MSLVQLIVQYISEFSQLQRLKILSIFFADAIYELLTNPKPDCHSRDGKLLKSLILRNEF